jgi:integrase
LRPRGASRRTSSPFGLTFAYIWNHTSEAKPIDRIDESDIAALVAVLQRRGKSPKTIRNILGTLHSVFEYARRRRWIAGNPVSLVDLPTGSDPDPDIHFLDGPELEALLRAEPAGRADAWWSVERVLYLTAAMTGLRQGELIGLRWRDVDWVAGKIRVRQSFVRGEFGAPKSKRSTRAVPMHDRVAGDLDRHFQHSAYNAEEDLVFAHPHTGRPLDRSKVLKRFKQACDRAGVRQLRFHDLRHTFGTRMAGAGVPMRTLQEWMGHRDFKTTLIYADYAPSADERTWITRAFEARRGPNGVQSATN